ncbi:MAG: histidine phosphatase family protein [Mycobacteriales bacterium]
MTTLLLVRHGLTEMTGPVLAGWTPGVHLDERGRRQAAALRERLTEIAIAAVVSSPLERCVETVAELARDHGVEVATDDRFGECGYGDWTGQELKRLVKDPLWRQVQAHPSAVTFPGGEALRDVQHRAVAAVREWNARVGDDVTWLACSHGDVVKAVVADALGLHLDTFQRIVADPASLTVIRYTALRPFLVRLNDVGSTADLLPPKRRRRRPKAASSDAPVGGGEGGAT